jgi:hypothetical protein
MSRNRSGLSRPTDDSNSSTESPVAAVRYYSLTVYFLGNRRSVGECVMERTDMKRVARLRAAEGGHAVNEIG